MNKGFTPLKNLLYRIFVIIQNGIIDKYRLKPRLNFRTGFTLLEILIALALLATAFLSLLTLQNQTVEMVYETQKIENIILMMREEMIKAEFSRVDQQGVISQSETPFEEKYPGYEVVVEESPMSISFIIPVELSVELTQLKIGITKAEEDSIESYNLYKLIAEIE